MEGYGALVIHEAHCDFIFKHPWWQAEDLNIPLIEELSRFLNLLVFLLFVDIQLSYRLRFVTFD